MLGFVNQWTGCRSTQFCGPKLISAQIIDFCIKYWEILKEAAGNESEKESCSSRLFRFIQLRIYKRTMYYSRFNMRLNARQCKIKLKNKIPSTIVQQRKKVIQTFALSDPFLLLWQSVRENCCNNVFHIMKTYWYYLNKFLSSYWPLDNIRKALQYYFESYSVKTRCKSLKIEALYGVLYTFAVQIKQNS